MKKIIAFLIMLSMMCFSVSALEQYTGTPSAPYLIFGNVEWNDQMLSGTRLEISNAATGYTTTVVTNGDGYWQDEATSWLTNAAARPPIMYGDSITVKALDGCGTGDICSKTFQAYTGSTTYEYKVAARVDITLTGTLSCPAVSCPSCDCYSGGSSSSIGYCSYSEEICNDKYPQEEIVCDCPELADCPAEKVCSSITDSCSEIDELCPEDVNTICDLREEKICTENECPIKDSNGLLIGSLIAAIVLAGASGVYFTRNQTFGNNGGLKEYINSNGIVVIQHKHPGIRGYHDPKIEHQEAHERHPKGQMRPHYEKNDEGVYEYKQ